MGLVGRKRGCDISDSSCTFEKLQLWLTVRAQHQMRSRSTSTNLKKVFILQYTWLVKVLVCNIVNCLFCQPHKILFASMKTLKREMLISDILNNNKKMDNFSRLTTYLTLAAAAIGFAGYIQHFAFWLLYIIVLIIPQFYQFGMHSWIAMGKLTVTTFVFGIVNGYSYCSVRGYLNGEQKAVPTTGIYLSLVTVYHYFQFQMVNNFHYHKLEWNSFLIYHSKQYTMANCFLLTQHIVTRYLFGFGYKMYHPLMWVGLVVAVLGEGLRIAAFFTCKSNFTHLVSFRKDKQHTLITNGIYSFFRHPAYTGYFYYCVFSMMFLGNFASMVAFIFTLIAFFNQRIQFEEQALIRFFGDDYLVYKRTTYILIPFVKDPDFRKYDRDEEGERMGQNS